MFRFTRAFSAVALSTLLIISPQVCALGKRPTKHRRVKPGNKYKDQDPVHVVVNKVGPFNNPSETYRYYSLPFCKEHSEGGKNDVYVDDTSPSESEHAMLFKGDRVGDEKHHQRLGEKLVGDRRHTSPYELHFKTDIPTRSLCTADLIPDDVVKFKNAIHKDYFFEMYIEDLPMWGFIGEAYDEDLILGETSDSKTVLFTHMHFEIGYNEDQIVSARVVTLRDSAVDITDQNKPTTVEFKYSVEWKESDIAWKKRMLTYHDNRYLPPKFAIHWLSVVNSIVLVTLLSAFVAIIIVRTLKKDVARYMDLEESNIEEEESGWKLIHGDVFRPPQNPILFSAAVGTGLQLQLTTLFVVVCALCGFVSTTRRGSILALSVVSYCLFSGVGGYFSTRLYQQMNGKDWVKNVLITALLFPTPLFSVFCYVNTIALAKGSTAHVPFGTIITILALFVCLSFPLTVIGGVMAKNYASKTLDAPTRTTKVAREIPTELPFYSNRVLQFIVSAFLPFSAIYIELNYIFGAMWGHEIYSLFGILFITGGMMVLTASFITVTLLYFQLSCEDHRWWWTTFANGGGIGLAIFLYSCFYYFHRSEMQGWLQSSFFFGYMGVMCFVIFLMYGSTSFYTSLYFVKGIYSRVKCD